MEEIYNQFRAKLEDNLRKKSTCQRTPNYAMSFEHKFHKTRRCKFLSECTCVSIPTTVIQNVTIEMKGLSA